ncbi:C45 family autoproteolytic acyltransferase/hydolase [Halobacillus mangrovi]|uniref:C45 family autoproteolytic acyltransferase/hydolase n=1 Tax=Halobacillus mangrovi TaxID=402384 RepID=UPI003D96DBBF
MKQVYSEVIQFQGNDYDFGLYQAKHFKKTPLYQVHKNRRKKSIRRYTINKQEVRRFFIHYAPGLWEELQGLADGLGWGLAEVLHEYSGFQQDWVRSGCSVMTGEGFFARNYDYHPKTYEGRFLLFKPNNGFASIGPGQRLIGRTDGMNEHGLCIGYNFVNRIKPEDGLICCTITRIILETAKNVREAVELLTELPHRHSFNYILYDREGNSRIIEGSPRGVKVKTGQVCTNHFDELASENRKHLTDSMERMDRLEQFYGTINTGKEAFYFLNRTSQPIFSKNYSRWSGTIHTSCYFPVEGSMMFGLGGDASPVLISFKRWLENGKTPLKRILGKLDTTEPLPYIEN